MICRARRWSSVSGAAAYLCFVFSLFCDVLCFVFSCVCIFAAGRAVSGRAGFCVSCFLLFVCLCFLLCFVFFLSFVLFVLCFVFFCSWFVLTSVRGLVPANLNINCKRERSP